MVIGLKQPSKVLPDASARLLGGSEFRKVHREPRFRVRANVDSQLVHSVEMPVLVRDHPVPADAERRRKPVRKIELDLVDLHTRLRELIRCLATDARNVGIDSQAHRIGRIGHAKTWLRASPNGLDKVTALDGLHVGGQGARTAYGTEGQGDVFRRAGHGARDLHVVPQVGARISRHEAG